MPKTTTNFPQYSPNYPSETVSPVLSSKLLNEGYATNLAQKSRDQPNIDAKSNSSSNTKSAYIDTKNVKDNRPKNTLTIDDFLLQKSLGEGKFGLVYQAIHK
jgi:hypothetical protein